MRILKNKKKGIIKKDSEAKLHRRSQILADFFNGEVIYIDPEY